MPNNFQNLIPMKIGILLALLTLTYGFGLGGVFGAFEEDIKTHLKTKAQDVKDSIYHGDDDKIKSILDKSWVYFKRAHLHANGLGTASLAMILLLSFIQANDLFRKVTAIALGIGSLGYASFWMFAALKAPALGSTGAAKESLNWLAVPTSFLCIGGLLAVLSKFVYQAFTSKADQANVVVEL
ncbi:MAG: hypothetical protein GWN00_02825 [Aliifodinibius sp.]|nr:hypothetical protein [Fodinibius sp.]NIV10175.1 hypothetical protein [Fodinibius sp.]NIY23788.1 hypothetical protein [Fodinibius sp.]